MRTAATSGYPGWTAASAASIVSRSIISIAAGRMRVAITPRHGGPAWSVESKPARSARPPAAEDADDDLRGDAQRAPRSRRTRPAGPARDPRAEPHELAVREDDLRLEHVVDGEAVLEAVGSSRVLGDVAPDRADLLAGGVGSVEESVRSDGLRDREVRDARLDGDARAIEVDLEDAVHPRERDDDPRPRAGAAGKARPGSARDEWDAVACAEANDRPNLLRVRGKRDQSRNDPVAREAVALVGAKLLRLGDHASGADRSLDVAHELRPHAEPTWIRYPSAMDVVCLGILVADAIARPVVELPERARSGSWTRSRPRGRLRSQHRERARPARGLRRSRGQGG